MARERQYWVVSPNVDGGGKKVEEWKKEILRHSAAILGWAPDNWGNGGMGPRFAGDPNARSMVQPGDIILIARGKKSADMVGFGVVKGEIRAVRLPPWDRDVYLRYLAPFKHCERAPKSVRLLAVLQHTRAFVPLHPGASPDAKRVCKWMEQQLKLGDREVGNEGTTSQKTKVQLTNITEIDLPESTFGYKVKTKSQVKTVRKAEAKLLSDYRQWLGKQGRRLLVVKINMLKCDAWEKERGNLIEAKGSTRREDIRMAVGELLDYAFQGKELFKQPNLAILLRKYPGDNRVNWLEPLRIKIIWSEGQSFVDNANGQFT